MGLLLITENKLKILLSKDDLSSYGITFDGIDYDNTATRRVFWSLLDEAKKRTGFDAAVSKIFIQVYPLAGGGCEMYVSRLRGERERERGVTLRVGGISTDGSERFVTVFPDLDTMIRACHGVCGMLKEKKSSAYIERAEQKRCFLITECSAVGAEMLCGYGSTVDSERYLRYINEHCKVICAENAVPKLAEL